MLQNNTKSILTKPQNVILLSIISCFLWGSAFPFIKLGYRVFNIGQNDTYEKILFAGIRFLLAGIMVMVVCVFLKYPLKINLRQFRKLSFLGILQTSIQYFFFYIGMSHISGTSGSIISSLGTFFTVIAAHFLCKNDKITKTKFIGLIIGLLGVIILNIKGLKESTFSLNGEGLLIISSVASAFASIYTKNISKDIKPFAISGYQLAIGGAVLTIVGLIGTNGKIFNFSSVGFLMILYMAFISAAAFSIWSILLKFNDVSKISVYKFSVPLFGVLLSFIILHENNLNINVFISIVLVSIGIILINKKEKLK